MSSSSPIPLILLSGMGADDRVFTPQKAAFPNLVVPRWIPPRKNESLSDYGKRFAREIDPGEPCYIGGASFGGMVAMEMAPHLDCLGCFLIGSIPHPSHLPISIRLSRWISPITHLLPISPVQRLCLFAEKKLGLRMSLTARNILSQIQTSEPDFYRWAMRAVLDWKKETEPPDFPIYHIHGSRDPVLPIKYTKPDRVVEGGGHVISLRHGPEVNRFLRECMERK